MIRQHFVRAFERGAGRDHRPNIELKRDVCEVTFDMEDSKFNQNCAGVLYSNYANEEKGHVMQLTILRLRRTRFTL